MQKMRQGQLQGIKQNKNQPPQGFFPAAVCYTIIYSKYILFYACGSLEGIDLVGVLPGQVDIGSADMAESGYLTINRASEVELLIIEAGRRSKTSFAAAAISESGIMPVPKLSTKTETGSSTPMA